MKIELLISTMNAKKKLLDKINIHSDVVVVNQCGTDHIKVFKYKGHCIKWIDSSTKGLSKSRNIALSNASGDIVILTDDDVEYVDDYVNKINTAFSSYPEVDIIAFQVEGKDGKFKDYKNKKMSLNYFTSMRVSSVEIAMKRKKILKHGIYFNESFGSGAQYQMGEENIFLFDCLKNKLKLFYIPTVIAKLWLGNSTWFKGFNSKYFFDRGATYYEMFGFLAPVMIVQFIVRKYRLIKEISLYQAFRYSFIGMFEWRSNRRNIKANSK